MSPNPPPADFYRACEYRSEESVSYVMKHVVGSIAHLTDQRLATHSMTSTQWRTLMKMRNAGSCTVAELAREQQVDAGAMTRLLGRLEKKGLCRRVRSNEDRRVVQVELTAAGVAAIDIDPAVVREVVNLHLAGFSKAELQTLHGYLHRMLVAGEAPREPAVDPAVGR